MNTTTAIDMMCGPRTIETAIQGDCFLYDGEKFLHLAPSYRTMVLLINENIKLHNQVLELSEKKK